MAKKGERAQTPEEVIRQHLGKEILTAKMRKELLSQVEHVGWILSRTQKEWRILYSCCGTEISDREPGFPKGVYGEAAHREYGTCPICGRRIQYIKLCHVRQDERWEHFFTFYRSSRKAQDTIVAIGVWVGVERWNMKLATADHARERMENLVQPRIEPCEIAILPYGGKPERYKRFGPRRPAWQKDRWEKMSNATGDHVQSLRESNHIGHTVYHGTLAEACRGTVWERVLKKAKGKEILFGRDHVSCLATLARHPQLEYMLEDGLLTVAKNVMLHNTGGAINWRAKDFRGLLPLDSNELARLKRMEPKDVRMDGLWLKKWARGHGQTVKLEDAMEMAREASYGWKEAIKRHGEKYGAMRILRYLIRQQKGRIWGAANMWWDYIGELQQLGEEDDMARVFPKNLQEAHAETSTRIKIKESEEDNAMIRERAEKLRKAYHFEARGMVLNPFETAAEVIREGAEQRICIGRYVGSYARGTTILCKLRRAQEPDKPWHAVEFSTSGRMVQCRGYKNGTWQEDEKDLRAFWDAWNEEHKEKAKLEIRINVREETA